MVLFSSRENVFVSLKLPKKLPGLQFITADRMSLVWPDKQYIIDVVQEGRGCTWS
jgi:hypothetical protein